MKKNSGTPDVGSLNIQWRVFAKQTQWVSYARNVGYHRAANTMAVFPAAFFEPKGFLKFETKTEFERICGTSRNVNFSYPGISKCPGFVAVKSPSINGTWTSDFWKDVSLRVIAQDQYLGEHVYSGTFSIAGGNKGSIKMEWNPSNRQFEGSWRVHNGGPNGLVSIRMLDGDEEQLIGAISVDPSCQHRLAPANLNPLIGLIWKRKSRRRKQLSRAN